MLAGLVAVIGGVTKIDFLYDTVSLDFPVRKIVYNNSTFLEGVSFPMITFDFLALN